MKVPNWPNFFASTIGAAICAFAWTKGHEWIAIFFIVMAVFAIRGDQQENNDPKKENPL